MTTRQLEPYRDTLASSVVFEHLTADELGLVMDAARLLDVGAGQLLLSEGRKGEGLYVILEGQVEFFLPARSTDAGRRPSRVRLNVLGTGRCFGEYGLIDDRPSSASAQALSDTRLCFLATAEFRRITTQHDHIGKIVYANLLRFLVTRLRSKDKELDLVLLDDSNR